MLKLFEDLGEAHFVELIRKYVLKNYVILPPGTVIKVDLLFSRDLVFAEVEDTIKEIYGGTKQLIRIAQIARIYNCGFVLIVPFPDDLLKAISPISYFFERTTEIGLKKKELWFVLFGKKIGVISLKLKEDEAIPFRPCVDEILIEMSRNELTWVDNFLKMARDKIICEK